MGRPQAIHGKTAHQGPVALIAAILTGSENLHGARCTEFPREFDPDVLAEDLGYEDEGERWQMVQTICRACPARGACWEWSRSLAWNRITGPTATAAANPFRLRAARRAAARSAVEVSEVPEGGIEAQQPVQRRGARSRVKPSVNRKRRRNRRRR